MRIENIGPDDIQVGDIITDTDGNVVTHVLGSGLVVATRGDGHAVFGWVNDAWRLDGNASHYSRAVYRDVPDEWERPRPNIVAPAGCPWVFMVDYNLDMLEAGPRQTWAQNVVAQTAQWLTDRLNEGYFGEMPTFDDEAEA